MEEPPSSPAASKRSWISSWTTTDPEELRKRAELKERIRAAAEAQRVERVALIARRDVLSYFETLRVMGPFLFLDTVPTLLNAVFTVSIGTLALFLDGGVSLSNTGGSCGALVHFFVLGLIGVSYLLLGLLTYVLMGYRVTVDITLPFTGVVVLVSSMGAVWVSFGIPIFLAWMVLATSNLSTQDASVVPSSFSAPRPPAMCLRDRPLLFCAFWIESRAKGTRAGPLYLSLFSLSLSHTHAHTSPALSAHVPSMPHSLYPV